MVAKTWQADLTVAAICVKDDKFLMVEERSKSNGKMVINQPAGHLEKNETVVQAVIRETREETCRHFVPEALIGLYRLPVNSEKTYFRYTFLGTVSELDKALTLDPDISSTHWLSYEEICASRRLRSPLVKACIDDYLAGQRYPLELLRELKT